VSDWQLVLLAAGSFTLWLVIERSTIGANASFFAYNLPGVGWFLLIALWMAWAISRRSRPLVAFRDALFVMFALAPLVAFAAGIVELTIADDWLLLAYGAIALYVVIYIARASHSITGKPQIPLAAVITLMLIVVGWFNQNYAVDASLWYDSTPDPEDATADAIEGGGESLLFDQPARIDAAIAKLQTAATPGAQVFFVGFAGVGEQRVFAEEIKLAAYKIGEKYGTGDRTVLLLNDRRDLNKAPLATVSGLRYALKGVAAKMNIDRDVLFLALSSHGSADPALSVSNSDLDIRNLTGDGLAAALKDSGIKWKVIVISACHAGAFIKPLRDDHTAILTAAAADRTSFGCSDDRDLTYFGEAFYRDAIPTTPTLRAAFAQTTRNIAAREKSEGIKASNPQSFFGAAMDQKLAEIERPATSVARSSSKD
jgi:hypothetical protein